MLHIKIWTTLQTLEARTKCIFPKPHLFEKVGRNYILKNALLETTSAIPRLEETMVNGTQIHITRRRRGRGTKVLYPF